MAHRHVKKVVNTPPPVQDVFHGPQTQQQHDAALDKALNDNITPGVIDDGELKYLWGDSGFKSAAEEAAKQSPLLKQAKKYSILAKKHWFFESKNDEDERKNAITEFRKITLNHGLIYAMPLSLLQTFIDIAHDMYINGGDEYVKLIAGIAEASLSSTYRERTERINDARQAKPGTMWYNVQTGIYDEDLESCPPEMSDLIDPVRFAVEVYTHSTETGIIAKEFSKENLQVVTELPRVGLMETMKELKRLNAELGCSPGRNGWVCKEKGADYYNAAKGMKPDFDSAAPEYLKWEPLITAVFEAEGVPGYLGAIAIGESFMKEDASAKYTKAQGCYQIIPSNTNIREYDIYLLQSDGYDERRNILMSARAAAKILKQGMAEIKKFFKNENLALTDEDAFLMATSCYHAGVGNFTNALHLARADFEADKMNGEITAVKLFTYLLKTTKSYGKYKGDSKDYPAKLFAILDVLKKYRKQNIQPVEDLVFIEISEFKKGFTLVVLAAQTNMNIADFRKWNPQFRNIKNNSSIEKIAKQTHGLRLVIPRMELVRFYTNIVRNKIVDPDKVTVISLSEKTNDIRKIRAINSKPPGNKLNPKPMKKGKTGLAKK